MPRPDSEPVFGRLLDPEGGWLSISPAGGEAADTSQYYLENTNILITEIGSPSGDRFKITDFCPRFEQYGRVYRPMALFRIVEPIAGSPSIRVSCRPVVGWNKEPARMVRGNSHLGYEARGEDLRLTTDMPLTYLTEETPFQLQRKHYFAFTCGAPVEDDLVQVSESFLRQTHHYWRRWVQHCSIPTLFQAETIRSALALKLHCYEDTGAILAALTTSLPEEAGGTRNWDYRYCWLRDAHFVLSAFHNLGHFEEMEGFLKFLLGIARKHGESHERLAPVYTLSQELPLPEMMHDRWKGYGTGAVVRTNNQAAEHVQNDVYGEMALTLAPIFMDERFVHLRDKEHEGLLAYFARLCGRSISVPDAGLWEFRNGWQEHTFTNLMAWAGLERISRVRANGYLKGLAFDDAAARDKALAAIEAAAREGSIRNGPKDPSFDAALALAVTLRLPLDGMGSATVDGIRHNLAMGPERPLSSWFYRYVRSDDFGRPASAFVICSFWVAQALARLGRKEEARGILEDLSKGANHVGLLSEHFHPQEGAQLGNFPQAYSHVGLINAAFAVSPPWSEVL